MTATTKAKSKNPIPTTRSGQTPVRRVQVETPMVFTGLYASQRIDGRLTMREAEISRAIQDGIEAQGEKCRGPMDVLRFLLDRHRDAYHGG